MRWLDTLDDRVHEDELEATERLHELIDDPDGVAFTMQFVDRVIRPDDDRVAAGQLASLVLGDEPLPEFLSPFDRLLLRAGARLGPVLPLSLIHI